MAYTETTTKGYGTRVGNSFKAIGSGILLFCLGTVLLWWNECRFYDNNPSSVLFDLDREFSLAGCIICHPTEMLGTIHLADQSGAKNWFDPNPQNTDLPQRSIGPDRK